MRQRKAACLEREMEQLSTQELDRLLQSELRREEPDENVVLPILKVLRQREADHSSEITDEVAVAWNEYQAKALRSERPIRRCWIPKASAIAAVIAVLILALPFAVDADGTMDVLYRLTDSVIEFFRPGKKSADSEGEYIFKTDNPGLQQVYETVVKMGITDPVVPMWLPEGYVLEELKKTPVLGGEKLYAKFALDDKKFVLQVKYAENSTDTQYEHEDDAKLYDILGNKHLFVENRGQMSALWVNGKAECMITTTENDQILYEIMGSIYRRE